MIRLHFTFGPVQIFVAQARRTRDLYAGSLLLSHLAMESMRAVRGGKIILPHFEKLMEGEQSTEHATAPNRFIAEFDSEAAAKDAGHAATRALHGAWRKIADAVWKKYFGNASSSGRQTAEIWARQRDSFWNISWVVGSSGETNLLDRRKNWQTHQPHAEGGDHCVLMGHLQELSGFTRSNQRDQQDAFWDKVRGGASDLDLETNERLCAVAFIKRFFPSVSREAIGRNLDPRGWPSTVTIAALPWIRAIANSADENFCVKAKAYADEAASEKGAILSSWSRIRLLKEYPPTAGRFRELSGNFINRTALANEDDTPLRDKTRRPALLKALNKPESATGARAGNFYAVLLMDGDSMGALIGEHGPAAVTGALTQFATRVPGLIAENDGVCVYAGGDDLLVLLPLDRALEVAIAARRLYAESFGNGIPATVSAAIVFAHYRCAFSRVLAAAHELLDDVAKDQTGRDSLAIRVLKPGGIACEWSAPFDCVTKSAPHIFAPLVEKFKDKVLTSSLLYNLRERFCVLVEGDGAGVKREDLLRLFTAEALIGKRDSENRAEQREETEPLMDLLVDTCENARRNPETKKIEATGAFTFDGPRLVKFLALDGNEGCE
jgi:CRISPR-associated protein Cmr2